MREDGREGDGLCWILRRRFIMGGSVEGGWLCFEWVVGRVLEGEQKDLEEVVEGWRVVGLLGGERG